MSEVLQVEAGIEEVRAAVAEALTPKELEHLDFDEREKELDPFEAAERGEAVTMVTVLIWTAQAVASGVVGGIAYDLAKKASTALVAKFGEDRVLETEEGEASDDA